MSVTSLPEVQTITTKGADLQYVEYGQSDGRPPLVLLHGISMPATHWDEFPHALGRHAFAIDKPVGEHAPDIPTMSRYAAKVIPAIHELAGYRYDLLGLSWGGILAQQIAMDDEPHTRRLVLAGTLPAVPLPVLSLSGGMPNLQALKVIMSPSRSADGLRLIYGDDYDNHPRLSGIAGRGIDNAEHSRQLVAASEFFFTCVQPTRRMLQANPPETLMLASTDDPVAPHRAVEFGARLLGMQFETIPAGDRHVYLLRQPEAMADKVNAFLDRSAS